MVTEITKGIKVSVKVVFRPKLSQIDRGYFLYSYLITIHNQSQDTVQLLKRQWKIHDSLGLHREVKGDGVIGEQPILEPNQLYNYESACDLNSGFGTMNGIYIFKNLLNGNEFEVTIPLFQLEAPHQLN